SATLLVTNVDVFDQGSYAVVVANDFGSVTSKVAALVVNRVPRITADVFNQTVNAGFPATFSVLASGSPTLAYQWYFNTTRITGATKAILTQAKAVQAMAGNYYVIVSNTFGMATSAVATLTVNDPYISISPFSSRLNAGQTANFSVTAF